MALRFERILPWEKERQEKEEFDRVMKFAEGKIPFEYHYEFPGGEKLEAVTGQDGQGHIAIFKEGKNIFDFASLLPKDYKFVTPEYFKKHPEEETLGDYLGCTWGTRHGDKVIDLGEFESPQYVLMLLHEIGHARVDKPEETKIHEQLEADLMGEITSEAIKKPDIKVRDRIKSDYEVLINEDMAKTLSVAERRAWAEAIKMMKNIQKDTGADFRAIFPDFASVKKYVNWALGSYRRGYEWVIKEGHDPDFYKELQRYFDRWQYE